MGAIALALLLSATPTADAAPSLPEAVAPLAEAARRVDAITIHRDGVTDVAAVRKRLAALDALMTMARPQVQGRALPNRRAAHLIVGSAHARFAEELLATRPPPEAMAPAAREAWDEQLRETGIGALRTAAAQLRACADLPAASEAERSVAIACESRLERIPGIAGGGRTALPKGERERIEKVAELRMPELQGCIDAWTQSRPRAGPLELRATLETDSIGGVAHVRLSPSGEGRDALYECLSDGLRIWVFPGVTEAEIELPIRIRPK